MVADDRQYLWEQLDDIQQSCARTEQHLRELNGCIERHENHINGLEEEIQSNRTRIHYAAGLASGVGFIASVLAVLAYIF